PLAVRKPRLAVAEGLDARLVARPAFVELLFRSAAAERPLAELVEVALDHRLDIDSRPAGSDDHARHPAAGVGNARLRHGAVRSGIGRRPEPLQQRAAGEELAPALVGAKTGITPTVARAEASSCRGEVQRRDPRDGYARPAGHRRKPIWT